MMEPLGLVAVYLSGLCIDWSVSKYPDIPPSIFAVYPNTARPLAIIGRCQCQWSWDGAKLT